MPVNFEVRPAFQIARDPNQDSTGVYFKIINNTEDQLSDEVTISSGRYSQKKKISIPTENKSGTIFIPSEYLVPGGNKIFINLKNKIIDTIITNWNLTGDRYHDQYDKINISPYFNDQVTQIFKNKYLSPRPDVPTYQLPEQGVGNWASALVDPEINDGGLRKISGSKGYFTLPDGIPFKTPSDAAIKNIVYTSQWDNYPKQVTIPLDGHASHAYLLMAGSTNPMQTRMTNGEVTIHYKDGTADSLLLKNPGTWWPIEQDYIFGQYAFHCNVPVPYRVHLQTGLITRNFHHYKSISGFTTTAVPGGAATVLDMPLNKNKILKSIEVKTIANDVVVGLMSITLLRN